MPKSDRIIKRQGMRNELAQLKAMVATVRPIVQAEQQLRKAYHAGYAARLKEEIAESHAAQAAKTSTTTEEHPTHETVSVLNS